jgi:hypothetical protein
MRHTSIERAPDDFPARLEDVGATEVLASSKGNRGQDDSRSTTLPVGSSVVTLRIRCVTHLDNPLLPIPCA